MAAKNPPLYLQQRTDHTAEGDRALLETLVRNEGVAASGDLKVTENGTPNMSVNVAAGRAFVQGDDNAQQGLYHVWNDATANVVISAADATNPRWDLVVARVKDAYYSGATNAFSIEVITGTPAASPAEPTLPNNCLRLARVVVGASVTSITNANITDQRPRAAVMMGGTVICTSTTRPTANLYEGLYIFETDTKLCYVYKSSAWYPAGTSFRNPGAKAYNASAQSTSHNTWTALNLTSEWWDTDSFHDTVTNNTRMTIPTGLGGRYLLYGYFLFTAGGTGTRYGAFFKNGSQNYVHPCVVSGSDGPFCQLTTTLDLVAGDYIELRAYQASGGALNTGSTSGYEATLQVQYLGPS